MERLMRAYAYTDYLCVNSVRWAINCTFYRTIMFILSCHSTDRRQHLYVSSAQLFDVFSYLNETYYFVQCSGSVGFF
jgi:hypothetical protein